MGSFSKDQSTSVLEALSGRLQSQACLPGNQSLSINQYPDWLIPPYSPSHPVCRHFVFPELPCCWSYSGTELTKLKHEFMQLCLCEGKEGGSRMQKAQIMLLPYHGPFSKPLIFCQLFAEITAWPSGWLRCIFVYTCSLVSLYYHIILTCQFSASLSPLEADTQVSFIKT